MDRWDLLALLGAALVVACLWLIDPILIIGAAGATLATVAIARGR
jgi:hypothetical protein